VPAPEEKMCQKGGGVGGSALGVTLLSGLLQVFRNGGLLWVGDERSGVTYGV